MAVFAKIRAGDLKLDQEVKKKNGAEGETRTRTWKPTLDPEPSASTSSATSARLNGKESIPFQVNERIGQKEIDSDLRML